MKKHFVWLILVLLMQTGMLYAINSYFHVDDITVAAPIPTKQNANKGEPKFDEEEVSLVGTSYDKAYYSVVYKKRVEVYKPKEATPVFGVDIPDGMHVSVMHWLPDENRLLYALANSSKARSGRIEVHVVDVSSGQDNLVKDLNRLSRGAHVKSFALSTYTNLLYLDVENNRKSDSIYQINIMKRLKRMSLPSYRIGNIALDSRDDLLYYEDDIRRQVFSYNGRRIKMITPDDWDYCLLGITKDDQLYIGRLDDGKVISIFKADKEGNMNVFADLAHSVPRENVMMGLNGQLVIKGFPADKYITVIRANGDTKTYNSMDEDAFITADAIFFVRNGKMHITYLE